MAKKPFVHLSEEMKIARRHEYNKVKARESRQRKSIELGFLRAQKWGEDEEIVALRARNAILEKHVERLESELSLLTNQPNCLAHREDK